MNPFDSRTPKNSDFALRPDSVARPAHRMVPRERPRAAIFATILATSFLALAFAQGAGADPLPSTGPFTVNGTVQSVELREMGNDLGEITGITHAGDNRLFITLRAGKVILFDGENFRAQPFLDITSLVRTDGFEQGLLSTAFHPHYADNGFFYVAYSNNSSQTVLERFKRSAGDSNRADPASGKILLTLDKPFANHNGGQLQFGPDGYLYLGTGDGGDAFDPQCNAQRIDSFLGKMLRLDVDQNVNTPPYYGIPASNPFRGPGNPPDEIWATGLRNPWRFSFDRETGDLWIGDVGQNHREEVDFQSSLSHGGENYGWKVMEATTCTNTSAACPGGTLPCNDPSYTPPVLEYDHVDGCSITGGYVYRGSAFPQLRGNYFFADYCSGTVWLAAPNGNTLNVRKLPKTISTLTTFGEDSRGELYAGTLGGSLYMLAPVGGSTPRDLLGLYEPAMARYHLRQANGSDVTVRFGTRNVGSQPVAGDWNGDGKSTIGFLDSRHNIFRLKNSLSGGAADLLRSIPVQPPGALALVGDWDGDGVETVGVYLPATGTFKLTNSPSGSGLEISFAFGPKGAAMRPVAGDWNGDGKDTVGVFNPANRTFYIANGLAGGTPDFQFVFGTGNNLLPVAGDWNGDGKDSVGVYVPRTSAFQLRNNLSAGQADTTTVFGPPRGGWVPIVGIW